MQNVASPNPPPPPPPDPSVHDTSSISKIGSKSDMGATFTMAAMAETKWVKFCNITTTYFGKQTAAMHWLKSSVFCVTHPVVRWVPEVVRIKEKGKKILYCRHGFGCESLAPLESDQLFLSAGQRQMDGNGWLIPQKLSNEQFSICCEIKAKFASF